MKQDGAAGRPWATTDRRGAEVFAVSPFNRLARTHVLAIAGDTPKRWRNRTLTATRAAVLGMARLTKQIANCRAVRGPSGSGRSTEPIVLTAAGIRGIWASTRAKASHHHDAPRTASAKLSRSTSPNAPMST